MQPIPVEGEYEVKITFVEPVKRVAVRPPFEYESIAGEIWMSDDFSAPLSRMKYEQVDISKSNDGGVVDEETNQKY